jgi:hypothetical protein
MKIIVVIVAVCAVAMTAYILAGKPVRADCKDGTISYSKSRSGACSSHGGVAKWR